MNAIGEQLRKAREEQGRTLEDIAGSTRINQKFLKQIEDGITPQLPESYVRAFIRSYAEQVGLNAEELLEKTEPQTEASAASSGTSVAEKQKQPPYQGPSTISGEPSIGKGIHRQTRILLVLSAVIVTCLVVAVIWLRTEKQQNSVQEISFPDVMKEHEAKQKEPERASTPFATEASSSGAIVDSLTLEATASESVWVRISLDGSSAREYTLQPRRLKRWKTREYFLISLANGGSVTFALNGQNLGVIGKPKQPMWNVNISRKNLVKTQKTPVKKEPNEAH